MRQILTHKASPRRHAFTLIELVVVLMVLVIVSGLVVTIAGWVRRSANYGGQAANQSALMANLEFFRTTYGNNGYPDFLDSLVVTGTSDPIHATPGYAHSGHTSLYTVGDLSPGERECLDFITNVMDHAVDKNAGLQGNPGNSAIVKRAFDGTSVAIVNTASGTGQLLAKELYPDGVVPTGVKLVAFGIGPSNTALGRTMQSPPHDARVAEDGVYDRFIAIFAVYEPRAGRRAQLKAVVNAMGRTQNNAASEFWQSTTPE
jgi:prepilin-type N-terminal cleavage/methylation domain-containing protein